MALGKTITYTPFEETSFAYGSTELASNYSTEFPNATDIVKVVIEHSSGNWNDTGHISTPSIGTAVSMYNKTTNQWICKGQRDDVDYVLSLLVFYPADKATSRPYDAIENSSGYEVLEFKENTTDGLFTLEQPPTIGDTVFTIKAYDGSDVEQISETITWDATEPTFDNQRPYFSTEPATLNYDSANYDYDSGATLDLGILAHGSDEEPINVTIYFSQYRPDTSNYITDDYLINADAMIKNNAFGSIIYNEDIYVNDKVPELLSGVDFRKFSFTGSISECQMMLDNIRYNTVGGQQKNTFDIIVSVSDGPTGSYVVKRMWHTQDLEVSTLPDQHYVEDVAAKFDLGSVVFENLDNLTELSFAQNNTFQAVITLDATGTGGTQSFGTTTTVDTETYSSGVLTLSDNNLTTLKTAIRNLEWLGTQDFATDFTFTVQFTFSNSTIGSSYTHTAQTVNVTAQEAAEVENITQTHTWNEDQVYYFTNNNPLQIIHPYNENFRVDFDYSPSELGVSQVGHILTQNQDVTRTVTNNRIVTFTGTRDQINDAMLKLQFAPTADNDQSFTINVTVERTSGTNLANVDVSTGVFTMTAIPQEEYSYTPPEKIFWEEDIDKVDFATGIKILDTSLEDPLLPAYGAKYKMTLRAKYTDGSAVSADDIAWSCFNQTNVTVTGSGTIADPLVITGDRADMNVAANSLRMAPSTDFVATQDFRFEYKLERGESTDDFYALYVNYNKPVQFDKGIGHDEFTAPTEIKFGIDRLTSIIDYSITDKAKNKQYEVKFTIDNDGEGFLRAVAYGNATVVFENKVLSITGNKEDVNATMFSVEFVPALNFNTDFKIYYYQIQTTDNLTQADGTAYFDMTFDPTLLKYELDTNNQNLYYSEDLLFQEGLLAFTRLKNVDGAEEITDDQIHYVTTVRLTPTDQIYFSYDYAESGTFETGALLDVVETRASELTFTGTRDYCNQKIKELVISGFADQVGDVDLIYTQERWVNGSYDETQANEVTALTIRGTASPEVIFSPYKQYFTSRDAITATGEEPTPRYLQEYNKGADGLPKNLYTIPIKIVDNASEPEGETLYKIEQVYNFERQLNIVNEWLTKEQFKEYIKNGIEIDKPDWSQYDIYHNLKFYIKVKRLLPSGTETTIGEGPLVYEYIPEPRPIKLGTSTDPRLGPIGNPFITAEMPVLTKIFNLSFSNEAEFEMSNGDANDVAKTVATERNILHWTWGYRGKVSPIVNGILEQNDIPYTDFFFVERFNYQRPSSYIGEVKNTDIDFTQNLKYSHNSFYVKEYATRVSHRYFYIDPFDQKTKGKFAHEVVSSYGLKGRLDIDYKQNIIKYSEHMSHSQTGIDNVYPVFGHDTAGLQGSWTITRDSYDKYSNDQKTMRSNAVLCSHFWVSGEKYAFGFLDSNDNTKDRSYPFDFIDRNGGPSQSHMQLSIQNFPIDKRYLTSPKGDKRMRTANNFYNFSNRFEGEGWGFGARANAYDGTFVSQRIDMAWSYPDDLDINSYYIPGTYASQGADSYNPTIAVGEEFSEQELYSEGKWSAYVNFDDRGSSFDCSIVGQSFKYNKSNHRWIIDFTKPEKYIPWLAGASSEYQRSLWFQYLGDKGININTITSENCRFDIQFSNETYIADLGMALPKFIWLVRSYFHNGQTHNEISQITPLKTLGEERDGTLFPRFYINAFDSKVYDGESEYNMWARRNAKDNTSRILVTKDDNLLLPTGEWWQTRQNLTGTQSEIYQGVKTFDRASKDNLTIDLTSKKIDKFIEVSSDVYAYVSVDEGIIDDGSGAIDIKFDNKLSESENYNYVYVTKDTFDPNKLYLMLGYLNTGDTYNSDATQLRSRLIYINLEE